MNTELILVLHSLNGIAIICTAVVFGTDAFFALVGKKSAVKSKESSIADVFGHFHELADIRMPFFGATAILTTLAQIIIYGIHSLPGKLSSGRPAGNGITTIDLHLRIQTGKHRPGRRCQVWQGIK